MILYILDGDVEEKFKQKCDGLDPTSVLNRFVKGVISGEITVEERETNA